VAAAGAEAAEGKATAVTSGAKAPLLSQALFGTGEPVPLSETNSADSRAAEDETAPVCGARWLVSAGIAVRAIALTWVFYATTVELVAMIWHEMPLPTSPVAALEPFRIANQYGLFAVMTPHRYEIEFQGSNDGENWVAYPFRYKPQDVRERPGIYAPYQPRFDWNLWFASLGSWLQNPMVPRTEELLLHGNTDVLGLFAGNPFPSAPPKYVRAVIWQYWFSTPEQKREQGVWWTRQYLGTYAPTIVLREDGRYGVVAEPSRESEPEE
jgi:hypothetical protein